MVVRFPFCQGLGAVLGCTSLCLDDSACVFGRYEFTHGRGGCLSQTERGVRRGVVGHGAISILYKTQYLYSSAPLEERGFDE